MIGFNAYAVLVWLSAFNSLDPFLLWGASIHGRWCYNLSQAIYQWDDYTLKLLVTKELLKAVPSYMSFRCWSEFWKVLNHHELVLGVTCKTSIGQKPSAHPSKHVTWIQFFALFFCLFLVLCFLCKFCATTCQGLPDATLSHSQRPRTTILSAFLRRSRKLLPKWSWSVWIRSCCAHRCFSWNLNRSGPDLMMNNVKKLYRVWSSTLTVSTGQSLCILFSAILLVTTIDVVMGSWNWGGGAWVANERWVLWSSTTLQPRCCNQHIQRSTWQVSVYNSEAPSVTDTWRTNSLIIGTHLSVTRQHHVLLTNNWCMV